MKRILGSTISSRSKKVACTVSAAALMLGVSSAASIGLHFQCAYSCGNLAYSGYPVTFNAFGIDPSGWENLLETPTGYGNCSFTVPGYEMEELIDSTTSTNGLNPLPNGSITVSWFANCSNFDPFYGYYGSPPYYTGGGPLTNPKTGEQEVYATFLRDGVNFGPNTSGTPAPYGSADNPLQAYYTIDVTGLKSLFTNTPFVVECIASADSMYVLTNALVTDVSNSITYALPYPSTPPVNNAGGAPWTRGNGGGLSLSSGVFSNADHIHIASAPPQHGGTGSPPDGFDNAGTISGFIITDKPVVSMPPQSVPLAAVGDSVTLSAYAIGVPPLSYQWRFNGQPIAGATTLTNVISSLTAAIAGTYDLVVTNTYGSATSRGAIVGEILALSSVGANIVYDSNPGSLQSDGINMGATWQASNSDGTLTRTGVMSFSAEQTNGITVPDNAVFDAATNGTITFWMVSAGTDGNAPGNNGAAIYGRTSGTAPEFLIYQDDSSGVLTYTDPGLDAFNSSKNVSDSKWHFVALTFDNSATGVAAFYIDGVLDTANTNAEAWSWPSGSPTEIGYTTDTAWRDYNGVLDDVRFYNAILSPSEISSIFAAGNSVVTADPAALQLELNFTSVPGGALVFSWSDPTVVLQTATSLEGPWVTVTGAASPYTVVPAGNQQFFRYSYTGHAPQAWISNPFLM